MKYLSMLLSVPLVVGCASTKPTWHAQIVNQVPLPDDEHFGYLDFASAYIGQKQFSREQAFEIMLNTTNFSTSGVGIGPEVQPQVYVFIDLLRQPDAQAIFEDLLQRAHPAGVAYALCGLYLVDQEAYDRAVKRLASDKRAVLIWEGCLGDSLPLNEISRIIPDQAKRLAARQQVSQSQQ